MKKYSNIVSQDEFSKALEDMLGKSSKEKLTPGATSHPGGAAGSLDNDVIKAASDYGQGLALMLGSTYKLANGDEEEEANAKPLNAEQKAKIKEFIRTHKGIDDDDFHEFAESLGVNVHKAEAYAYELASKTAAEKEVIPGGKASGKDSAEFDKKQIQMGMDIEQEHTPSKAKAKEIAKDHLTENPGYYTDLKAMEASFKKKEEASKKASWIDTFLDKMAAKKRDMPSLCKQDRPAGVCKIDKALKKDHPGMSDEMRARIAIRQGKPGKQKQGPPYKGQIKQSSLQKSAFDPGTAIGQSIGGYLGGLEKKRQAVGDLPQASLSSKAIQSVPGARDVVQGNVPSAHALRGPYSKGEDPLRNASMEHDVSGRPLSRDFWERIFNRMPEEVQRGIADPRRRPQDVEALARGAVHEHDKASRVYQQQIDDFRRRIKELETAQPSAGYRQYIPKEGSLKKQAVGDNEIIAGSTRRTPPYSVAEIPPKPSNPMMNYTGPSWWDKVRMSFMPQAGPASTKDEKLKRLGGSIQNKESALKKQAREPEFNLGRERRLPISWFDSVRADMEPGPGYESRFDIPLTGNIYSNLHDYPNDASLHSVLRDLLRQKYDVPLATKEDKSLRPGGLPDQSWDTKYRRRVPKPANPIQKKENPKPRNPPRGKPQLVTKEGSCSAMNKTARAKVAQLARLLLNGRAIMQKRAMEKQAMGGFLPGALQGAGLGMMAAGSQMAPLGPMAMAPMVGTGALMAGSGLLAGKMHQRALAKAQAEAAQQAALMAKGQGLQGLMGKLAPYALPAAAGAAGLYGLSQLMGKESSAKQAAGGIPAGAGSPGGTDDELARFLALQERRRAGQGAAAAIPPAASMVTGRPSIEEAYVTQMRNTQGVPAMQSAPATMTASGALGSQVLEYSKQRAAEQAAAAPAMGYPAKLSPWAAAEAARGGGLLVPESRMPGPAQSLIPEYSAGMAERSQAKPGPQNLGTAPVGRGQPPAGKPSSRAGTVESRMLKVPGGASREEQRKNLVNK